MISSLIFTITLGTSQLDCALERGSRVIEYDGRNYQKLTELVTACPEVRQSEHRVQFAQAANFLFKGLTYEVIDDIKLFQKKYKERLEKEANSLSLDTPRLADFGNFDLGGMHPPHIENDHMVFYVQHSKTKIPYEVSVALTPAKRKATYRLLPFASEG